MFLVARVAVSSVRRLSPSFVRIELAGPQLAEFGVDGPTYDQRIKIIFPGPSGRLPELDPDDWWSQFQALPEPERCSMRTYTIRAVTGTSTEPGMVVDFVLHPGAHGPGSDWAAAAQPGDEVLVVVPRRGQQGGGIEWAPPVDARRLLLVGDETAVPAIASILESLPAGATGTAVLEVPLPDDLQQLPAPAGIEVRWVIRNGAPIGTRADAAVRELLGGSSADGSSAESAAGSTVDPDLWETPSYSSSGEQLDTPASTVAHPDSRHDDLDDNLDDDLRDDRYDSHYCWIAGESGMVTALRRHLVQELGLPRRRVAFMGYWRDGVAMRG